MNVATVRAEILVRVLVLVTPLALMMSGQARAEDVPTPSGSYSITMGGWQDRGPHHRWAAEMSVEPVQWLAGRRALADGPATAHLHRRLAL